MFRAGDTYVATAYSRAREGYWQTIHATDILKSPTAVELGQLALEALGISGTHKRFLDNTMPTIAADASASEARRALSSDRVAPSWR